MPALGALIEIKRPPGRAGAAPGGVVGTDGKGSRARDGRLLPEFIRFAVVPWSEAIADVGKAMARVLTAVDP